MTLTGIKETKARKALFAALQSLDSPQKADDIISLVPIPIHKVTVYRDLKLFVQAGLVEEVQFEERSTRYQLKRETHNHHLICEQCGIINEVELPGDLDEEEKRIQKNTGFTVLKHSLEFYGICRNCR